VVLSEPLSDQRDALLVACDEQLAVASRANGTSKLVIQRKKIKFFLTLLKTV